MKYSKENQGITLIALVVTIVVLIILAAVSISMLMGENGIIKQAQESKEQTDIGDEKEAINLAYGSCKIVNLGENVTDRQLEDELKAGGKDVTVTQEGEKLIVTYNQTDRTYEVDQNGNINEITESNIIIKLTLINNNIDLNANELPNVKEVTNENVPIPQGFYYVGGTKNEGVVISDIEGDDLSNSKQGNQFVWVPVNQNQRLMLEVISKENITGITVTNPDKTTQTLSANGKEFSQEITTEKNGTYKVEVTTATDSKTVSKTITSLYAQDFEEMLNAVLNHTVDTYINQFKAQATTYNTTLELLEANGCSTVEELLEKNGDGLTLIEYLLTNSIFVYDKENEIRNYYENLFREQLDDNYIDTDLIDENQNKDSVNKYGGFYIARYEAGDGLATAPREKGDGVIPGESKLVSQKGKYVYNLVDYEEAKTKSNEMYSTNSSVTSQMITGAGWDRTLNWIIETGSKTEYEVYIDSSNWGNYNNSVGNAATNSGNAKIDYTTGRSEYWKTNNIYDLAGNMDEMTQEKSNDKIVIRGGRVIAVCNEYYPAGQRDYITSSENDNYLSFRIQLFINI